MADSTISQLPVALTVSGSDLIPIDQGGVTKRATLAQTGLSSVIVSPGKTLYILNTITFTGTDGVTITLPTTSATMARTDAAQTFTGVQTFSSTIVGNINTASALFTARTIDGVSFDGTTNITVVAPATHAAPSKTTPVDADELPLYDSVTTLLAKLTWANLKTTLGSTFAALAGSASQAFSVLPATTSTNAPAASQIRIKNDIVNGQFRIPQAGTSFVAPASNAYDMDGWFNVNTSAAVFTIAQVAGSTTGGFARQVTITTADASIAAGDLVTDQTRIEGYNVVKYVGNTFTIAFKMKAPVAGVHCIALVNSGSDRSYVHEINFPVANVLQDCSITVTGGLPAAGTWDYVNGIGLKINFVHAVGSTFQTSTVDAWQAGNYYGTANQVNDCATNSNVWALEDVRIALGTFCPPDDSTYDEDLRYCQRYYQIGNIRFDAFVTTGNNYSIPVSFKVNMRAAPTVAVTNVSVVNFNAATNTLSINTDGFSVYHASTATSGANFVDTWTAAARL